ncbi:myrosinase 1-like [Anthonomus grandis grandis]|uniref:myrosinase 1-like n=1 Tax=Anthonomus grandis grandis TaxID=2921223 RepID=UPI002165AAB9|nr:myrosinase 1-like [Anthonomus grandis grandis]
MCRQFFIFCILVSAIIGSEAADTCNSSIFPSTFKFGAGTSAFQIEGGWNEDGKSRSWWDWFSNSYSIYINNATGNTASDSYHQYKQDIASMVAMGLPNYRFSLSWTRILPKGLNYSINQAGVDYYNNLLDELEAAGIEPLVTIYHWDTPYALDFLGGWTNPKMVDYFVAYADIAFNLFGDRVKLWATINEPKSFCEGIPSVVVNLFPEMPIGTYEYLCGHHAILAHAKAYRLYKEKYQATQQGRVSLVLDLGYNMGLTNSTVDEDAAERKNLFEFGWFAHPIVYGDYPDIMQEVIANNSARQGFPVSRLPKFTSSEKLLVQGAYDLIMLNTYTSYMITMANYSNSPSYQNDLQTSTSQSSEWLSSGLSTFKVHPEGTRKVLKWISDTYASPEIIITENGFSDNTATLNDTERISFINGTLTNIRLSMCDDGVNVTGYFYWSLIDSMEWNSGYTVKFGLVQVDFDSENHTRTLKNSAYYYKNVIETRLVNG